MDDKKNSSREEDKNRQTIIMRRYIELVARWYDIPPSTKTLIKLLPIFIILAAIPLTVRLLQQPQSLIQNAAAPAVYQVPSTIDSTGATDVSAALNSFIASVPDNSIIQFPPQGKYLLSQGIQIAQRKGLTFEGNGSSLIDASSSGGSDQLSSLFVLGHAYQGSWSDNNNNITVQDFTLIGNNTKPGVFTPGQEGEAGMEIEGTNNLLVQNVTVKGVFGDGFKIGDASNGVHLYNNTVQNAGRNDVSIVSGSNIEIDHNNFTESGYITFDIEPNTSGETIAYVNYHDNVIGSWKSAEFFAVDKSQTGAGIHDITVNNNIISYGSLKTWVASSVGRKQNITFTNNVSTLGPVAGPVLTLAHIDGLNVYGNLQSLTSGSLAQISDCTNVVTAPPSESPTPTPKPTAAP